MSVDTSKADDISDEEQEEILQEIEHRRTLRGVALVVITLIAIAFSAFQMWIAARGYRFGVAFPFVGEFQIASLQQLQVNAIHVTFALVLGFLLFPSSQGDGFVSRRLGTVAPAVSDQFGADHPLAQLTDRLARGVRWAAVDSSLTRITPIDILLAVLSLLPAHYIVTEFDEIRRLPIFGIHAARPIQEVYPVLEPIVTTVAAVGLPLDEISYAYLLGILGILLVLEATRRALGALLMTLVGLFIVYARWGYHIPRDSVLGALSIPVESWGDIVYNLWYTTEAGVFSTPVSVSVRFIYIFILFGAFLEMSGAGKWFIDLAYSLTGTRKGGPAKASVVSSGFMGMLSGSSIANTVTTGAFTIPLMKRSGYSPEFSGAVESSSSSGGQVLPPVMGAAAFLIVEFTGTPYPDVIVAATLPALAFFFGMWVMVHFEAGNGDIGGLSRVDLPDPRKHFRQGWFYLLPLVLLLYFLIVARFSINRAGWYTIVAVIALISLLAAYEERTRLPLVGGIVGLALAQCVAYTVYGTGLLTAGEILLGIADPPGGLSFSAGAYAAVSDLGTITILVSVLVLLVWPQRDAPLLELDEQVDATAQASAEQIGRPSLADTTLYRFGTFIFRSMESGARTATTVVIAVAAAGVIPGVISVSGLGPNLNALILTVSGESFLLLLLLSGIAAIIFGMGMPTTVMYIILIAMLGPTLEAFGIPALGAHLYILYFGLMADVTPPVAVAAFAGAGVAKADEFATATKAFLLSLNKILVPFAFVFSPGILLLRQTDNGARVLTASDVTSLSYFVPEVVIPILGMFLGVYALGVTIIGHQYASIDRFERVAYAIASILLMVPDLSLLVADELLGLFGLPGPVTAFYMTGGLRLVGLIMLALLSFRNRSRVPDEEPKNTPAPGDA
ncbi:TRAP transporter permease [Halocatena salina]|uniref:TRAP transporter fused permease subunit n=1 Tax=Halocatena salina TaxID=2934340 RepID=A0A8U0A1L8_9EURY|nr:TRAP transporter fused permease subunit [Halocatena salina]UPM42756.1 TRAP transporter fused permease subunit [Halocatena salina]